MKRKQLWAVAAASVMLTGLSACGSDSSSTASSAKEVVVYTADGLNDGDASFYQQVSEKFTDETGIKVKIVEAGSGEVTQRVVQEQANTQADILATLPPFIQTAQSEGLLESYTPAGSDQVPADDKAADGTYHTLINNYLTMIRNSKEVPTAPATLEDLLTDTYEGKLQYSTPGVAGDGTAFVILVRELLGQGASDYLEELQKNNVGPSDSTGQLAAKVDKGELLIANGDVQMNYAQSETMPNLSMFFPDNTTLSLPYAVGLVKDAPHQANAKKFLDYLFGTEVQEMTTTVAGGFPARTDVEPTGPEADELFALMKDVEVLHPDWNQIAQDLDSILAEYNQATGTL